MIRKILTPSLLLIGFAVLSAQTPPNDDCSGLIDLGTAPICNTGTLFSNVNATASNIGSQNLPGCFANASTDRDVWFAFTASDTIFDYTITVLGREDVANGIPALQQPQVAIYRGSCLPDGLFLLGCASAQAGESSVKLNLIGLTPGIPYFLRINDWSNGAPNAGAFELCIKQRESAMTIDQGGSTACSGELYDSGGPNGDYAPNENHVFTICPTDFHNCINFNFEFYHIDNTGDELILYDGDDTNAPVLAEISGFAEGEGGGGVCLSVGASSGCITVQFVSDGSVGLEGFHAFWECSQAPCEESARVEAEIGISEADIQNAIQASNAQVTITDIQCHERSLGLFTATDNTGLGLSKGLVLTTGRVLDDELAFSLGITNPGSSFASTANFPSYSDDELDYLSQTQGNGQPSFDACIVEMDVFTQTNQLTFEFVFGSEEYPEWVGDDFNDIFAFLVSGPGINGDPNINNQLNIATLPGGTPIQINNLNHIDNWQYFRNNAFGQGVVYDGLTSDFMGSKKSLSARLQVQPCETYHLKLAIADRGDLAFDSGVFIAEISGGAPELFVNFLSGIDYLAEGCTAVPDQLVVQLDEPSTDTTIFQVQIGGSATPGVDYTLPIPDTLVFLPGELEQVFELFPISDLEVEGIETIEITLVSDFGCGPAEVAQVTIEIHDQLDVEITTAQDTAYVCTGGSISLEATGATTYFWSPPGVFDDPLSPTPVATPPNSMWVSVTGTTGTCMDTDSLFLEVLDPVVDILPDGEQQICEGEALVLQALNNVNGFNLMWTPAVAISDPHAQTVTVNPSDTITYFATIQLEGCSARDSVTVLVDDFDFPELTGDTTICQNSSVDLGEDIHPDSTATTYSWSPDIALDPDATVSGPVATPETTTTYTLTATSASGLCQQTGSVTITVLPADAEIVQGDSAFLCVGDSIFLDVVVEPSGADFAWSPDLFISSTTETSVQVWPPETTTYFVTVNTGSCQVTDSIVVVVDSLPYDLSITADPEKESYCEGEQILLTSPTYEPANFPGIEHLWDPTDGALTPDTFLNMVIIATETLTYVRTTTNRACSTMDSIEIVVTPVASMQVIPQDTVVCLGESVQLLATSDDPIEGYMWEGEILSCTDCPNPIATPTQPGPNEYNVTGEFGGCPVGASATIQVIAPPAVTFPDSNICLGDDLVLNLTPSNFGTYQWTASDGSLDSNDPAPVVAPTQATTYFVTTSFQNCTFSDQITVEVSEPPVFDLTDVTSVCPFERVQLNLVEDPDADYFWSSDPEGFSSNEAMPVVTVTETTTYTLTIRKGACIEQASVTIEVPAPLAFNFPGPSLVCPGDAVQLNTAVTPDATYSWTFPGGSSSDPLFTPTVNETTTFFLNVTNTTPGGEICELDTAVTIEVVPAFALGVPSDMTVCPGTPVTFTATLEPPDANVEVEWIYAGGPQTGTSVNVTVVDTLDVLVTATDELGCDQQSGTFTVFTFNTIFVDSLNVFDESGGLITSDSILVEGQPIVLTAVTLPPAPPNAVYQWFLDGELLGETTGNTFTTSAPEISGNDPNAFMVFQYEVRILDANGCQSNPGQAIVAVQNNVVEIPNAFTPNDDDFNDFFNIVAREGELVEILEFKVYNRWGQLVYDNEDPDRGWDGTHKGEPAPSDVYAYRIVYRLTEGSTPIARQGEVTLIR